MAGNVGLQCAGMRLVRRRLVGPELVQITSEKVKVVRDNLKIARDRQKSYADNRRRDLQFKIGDQVFLKISLGNVYLDLEDEES